MGAALLGSLSFEDTSDHVLADQFDDPLSGLHADPDMMGEDEADAQPAFVRGSVLDAFAAHNRVERALSSGHIAAIDSDDNGIYRLFRTR